MGSETLNAIAALASASAAWVAVWFARSAAKTSVSQTRLQREIAEAAAQPYVWADIRGDRKQGTLINLMVGNSGPTIATSVRIEITPDLPSIRDDMPTSHVIDRRLKPGLKSLAPGAELIWPIGVSHEILGEDKSQVFVVRINAEGPYGPIPELFYEIDLADFRETADQPDGSLHLVRKAIEKLPEEMAKQTYRTRVETDG